MNTITNIWNRAHEMEERVRLRLCWQVRWSAEWGLGARVIVEGEREGAHCRYGLMNVRKITIMNHLEVWQTVSSPNVEAGSYRQE
jgi:hypothetical protein